ncbi:MAG TPA: sigma-70 family RNA polymerase sigma factor [Humisphaera sp.]
MTVPPTLSDDPAGRVVRELLTHRDTLFAFVLTLTRSHDLAEELFQELGVAVLAEARRGVVPEQFLPWARTIARHRVADFFRARSRRAGLEVPLDQTDEAMQQLVEQAFGENPLAAAEARERARLLTECLGRLGKRAREIVDGFYRDREPIAEIAGRIGWKPNAVKVALAKTRKALAECVSAKLEV